MVHISLILLTQCQVVTVVELLVRFKEGRV